MEIKEKEVRHTTINRIIFAIQGFSLALSVVYLLSFTRFQMKKDTKDTAKEIIPKVSSLGQGAKWVN